jgi:hypothetical protein
MPGYPLPMMYYPPIAPVIPGALDLATCVYNSDTTTVRNAAFAPLQVAYDGAGTQGFCGGHSSGPSVQAYNTSPAYILPGGNLPPDNGNGVAIVVNEDGWRFSPDGLKLYTSGVASVWDLLVPYEVGARVLNNINAALNSSAGNGSIISRDGLTVYETVSTTLNVWYLSIAWDLTSAVLQAFSVVLPFNADSLYISNDETRIYGQLTTTGVIREYIMATPRRPNTIPQSLGVAVPNFSLTATDGGVTTGGSIYISDDMAHLLVGGAIGGGFPGCKFFSYTGTAIT